MLVPWPCYISIGSCCGGSCRRGKSGFMGLSPDRNNASSHIQKIPLENRIIHVLSMLHLHMYVLVVVW